MGGDNGYKRTCEALTSRGEPCKASPLKGSGFCLAHDPKARERAGFVARNGRQGRKRKPTTTELFERWWNDHEGAVYEALRDALHADRAVVVGTGPKARLELTPDYELRLRAARELMDRRHGKPKQTHDVTTHREDEVDREIRRLLAEMNGRDGDRESAA